MSEIRQGKIEPGVLPTVFRQIYLQRATGTLRFALGGDECSVRFVRGHVVYGAASAQSLHMGEVMVAEGMLSEEHLHRATELVVAQNKRLGEALLELGIVDDELLEEFLAIHVRAILVHVFSLRAGSFYFEEQDPETSLEVDFPLKMSTGEMLMDAVRELKDPEIVRFGIGKRSRVLLQSTEPLLRFQRITLTPIDGFVLSRVDGTLSIDEVVKVTPLPPEAIEGSLFALLCAGILELAPTPKTPAAEKKAATAQFLRQEILELHGRVSSLAAHEVLGVSPEASPTEAKAAYMKLAKRYHPDVHHDPALADLRDKLEGIFFALNDAYQAMSSPKPTEAPAPPTAASVAAQAEVAVDDGERAAHAEQMFGRAQENFQAGKYWEALALAGEVVYLSQGRMRRRARILLARCYMKRSESLKNAEQELMSVIGEDADNADAHFYLGMLFDQTGRSNRAASMFRRVLEIDPRHRDATAELQRLESKGGGERGGLLGKLFGKG